MARQPAAWNPVAYAVWYAHASGRFAELSVEVEALLSAQSPLTDTVTAALYTRHIESASEAAATKASSGLQTLLDGMESASHQTGEQFAVVKLSLDAHQSMLAGNAPADRAALEALVRSIADDTRRAGATQAAFAASLESTNAEVALLRSELTQAKKEAGLDALTGVPNRRGFDEAVELILAERHPGSPGLVLMMLDLDHFKRINDSFGHVFGDRVLKAVAQVIKSSIKGRDLVARFGGEEFVVLLCGASMQGALSLANQIRESVGSARIRRSDDVAVGSVTVSIGVAELRDGEGIERLIERADGAL